MFQIKEVFRGLFQVNWNAELILESGKGSCLFQFDLSSRLYELECFIDPNTSRVQNSTPTATSRITLFMKRVSPRISAAAQERTTEKDSLYELPFFTFNIRVIEYLTDHPICVWTCVSSTDLLHFLTLRQNNVWRTQFGHTFQQHYNHGMKDTLSIRIWLKFQEPNVIENLETLNDFIRMFRQTPCDITFRLSSGVSIGAHLFVLRARSPVFSAMFRHDTQESATKTIALDDVEADVLKDFLYYLYVGSISHRLTHENAQPLYCIANKYDVSGFQLECLEFLLSNIQVSNAISLLAWSQVYEITSLKQIAVKFIAEHAKQICNSSEWVAFVKEYPDASIEVTRAIINSL